MPRRTDYRCRTCSIVLAFDEERYCAACSNPATVKVLNTWYRKTAPEPDERAVTKWTRRKIKKKRIKLKIKIRKKK